MPAVAPYAAEASQPMAQLEPTAQSSAPKQANASSAASRSTSSAGSLKKNVAAPAPASRQLTMNPGRALSAKGTRQSAAAPFATAASLAKKAVAVSSSAATDRMFSDTHAKCKWLLNGLRVDITICEPCEEEVLSALQVLLMIEVKARHVDLDSDDVLGRLCSYGIAALQEDLDRHSVIVCGYNHKSFIVVETHAKERRNQLTDFFFDRFCLVPLTNAAAVQLLLQVLLAPVNQLGRAVNPLRAMLESRGYVVGSPLGRGVSGTVMRLRKEEEGFALKRFRDADSYAAELENLRTLQSNIGSLPGSSAAFTKIVEQIDNHRALVLQPLCTPMRVHPSPITLSGVNQLVDLVQWCATHAKLVHYDLRPDNIMYTDNRICVVDWAHAFPIATTPTDFGGTIRYGAPEVVTAFKNIEHSLPGKSVDISAAHALHSVIRVAFSSLFSTALRELNNMDDRRVDGKIPVAYFDGVHAYWQKQLSGGLWKEAVNAADAEDYAALKKCFKQIFSVAPISFRT